MRKAKISLAFVMLALVLVSSCQLPASREINVTVDGVRVEFIGQRPIIVDGHTYVPIRAVFEALGFGMYWDQDAQIAFLTTGGYTTSWIPEARAMSAVLHTTEVVIPVGRNSFSINDEVFELDLPAIIIGGVPMLPVPAVLESLGHHVRWDGNSNTVIIRNLAGFHSFVSHPGAMERQLAGPSVGDLVAIIHTNFGPIHLRLFPDLAPLTVENFITHAQNGYYDGLLFHRVINNFVIQGGCPLNTGLSGESIWGGEFGDELTADLRHFRGSVSMSNFGPNTNVSRFFITQATSLSPLNVAAMHYRLENQDEISPWGGLYYRDIYPSSLIRYYLENGGTPHLDFGHAVFGQVYIGMDVVDTIASLQTGEGDRPFTDVIIETIQIMTFHR